MSLSKDQIEAKEKFQKWFWIWERDLLECARRYPEWRELAHELKFKDKKIDAPWTFPDAGRLIKYMEIPQEPKWADRIGETTQDELVTWTCAGPVDWTAWDPMMLPGPGSSLIVDENKLTKFLKKLLTKLKRMVGLKA
jgi:hypothetical protein